MHKDPFCDAAFTPVRAHGCFHNGSLLPHAELESTLSNHHLTFFKYLQLRHFLQTYSRDSPYSRDHTPLELLCLDTEPQGHLISATYSLLFSQHIVKNDKLVKQWESDLSLDLSPQEWDSIFTLMHKGSINVSTQENRFKVFSKWYRTPYKIHKFHPAIPPTCWRCGSAKGTLLHIWWSCSLIQPFWQAIHRLITQISTYSPTFTPERYLLQHTPVSPGSYNNSLTIHLIKAASLCIPAIWRSTSPPTIQEWIRRVDKIAEMEKLICQANDNPTKFNTTWACWLNFRQSPIQTNQPTSSSTNTH